MKFIFKFLINSLLASLLCLSIISCGKSDTDTSVINPEEIPHIETPEIIPEPEPEPIVLYTNPFTGVGIEQDLSGKRPVAMMINNIKVATPQLGISEADILYECIVEGGITRLLAIFPRYESLPATGSVRSARDYFIDIAQSHDAIYAHCGGSPDAYTAISERRIDNLDGVNGGSVEAATFPKDRDRVRNMGYEHASMTDGDKLRQAISSMNFRTQLKDGFSQPLTFLKEDTVPYGDTVMSLNIKYSGYAQSFFCYDAESGEYLKGQYGKAHIDGNTGETLSFKNVIVLEASYSPIPNDEYHRLDLNFTGQGKGYYVTDGIVRNIIWKKADRQSQYTLYESDGKTELSLNPGKSYIGIASSLSTVTLSETFDYSLS